MAALDFPNSPTTNQLFTAAGVTWKWDGVKWVAQPSGAGGAVLLGQQVFTASGTYVPSPGMATCMIECVGGGAGGGGSLGSSTNSQNGPGGGSGGYSRKFATAAQIGASQVVTVGAGGTAGTAPGSTGFVSAGGAGGTTSVGSLCIANGGSGNTAGNGVANFAGGAGAVPGTGDIAAAGAPGEGTSVGGSGIATGLGAGGSSIFGGGAKPQFSSGAANGIAATAYGSGGSGGTGLAVAATGGAGSSGIVIITEYAAGGGVATAPALPGYIGGLTLSNDTTTPATVIDVALGGATSDDALTAMILPSNYTKNCNAAWAVGSGNGGLDSGSAIPVSAWLHVFVIMRTDTGAVDVLVSQSATAPTMPTSYTKKRRIGSIKTASSAILAFTQVGDQFLWKAQVTDANGITGVTAATALLLTVPTGVQVIAYFQADLNGAGTPMSAQFWSPDMTNIAVSTPLSSLWTVSGGNAAGEFNLRTNISGQIMWIASTATATVLYLNTRGWQDNRGK